MRLTKIRNKLRFLAVGTGFLLLAMGTGGLPAWAAQDGEKQDYYTVYNEQKQVVFYTAENLSAGDEYIAADNRRYRVERVAGRVGYARMVGKEAEARLPGPGSRLLAKTLPSQKRSGLIAIYHTHSDESYVPTDGKASIYGHGGIFKVGNALTEKLESLGYRVEHSLRPHDPHDANAYYRSRRTAVQLQKSNPMALIDVHRDAVPPNVYSTKVGGRPVTRVRIVLGRTNPRLNSNLAFAKQIKAAIDQTHPNVFEGILLSKADFNQDLNPRAILVEVGAHTNSRYAAQEGVALFAEALPRVLGAAGGTATDKSLPATSRADWKTLLLIVLVFAGAAVGFIYLNKGKWNGIRR